MEKLGSHCMDTHVVLYSKIFGKSVEEIQVLLKHYKNNGDLIWRCMYIYDNISLNSSYNKKYFGQKL